MPYTKNTWRDEALQGDTERYTLKKADGEIVSDDVAITLKNTVLIAGTPVTAERMNHMEDGIAGAYLALDIATGLKILGFYATEIALRSAVTSPHAGDAYGVGTAHPYDVYIWDGVNSAWVNTGAQMGAPGTAGLDGAAATIAVGNVATGEPGTTAQITNSGTSNAAVFNFTIPRGGKGDKGDTGAQGIQGIQGVQGEQGIQGEKGAQGEKGDTGHGFVIKGFFATVEALTVEISNPAVGDAYGVGASDPYDIYVWNASTNQWINNGQLKGAKGDPGDVTVHTHNGTDSQRVSYNDLKDKPDVSTPSAHAATHAANGSDPLVITKAQISDFPDVSTPTLHAATHGAGGSDAITISKTQISDFPTAMAPTAHAATHAAGGTDAIQVDYNNLLNKPITATKLWGVNSIEFNRATPILENVGGIIDFHYNGSEVDYTSRIIEDQSGKLTIAANLDVTGALTVNGQPAGGGGGTAGNGTLAASAAWNTQTRQQTIAIASTNGKTSLIIAPNMAVANSYEEWVNCGIRCVAHSGENLTFQCESIPTIAIGVSVLSF